MEEISKVGTNKKTTMEEISKVEVIKDVIGTDNVLTNLGINENPDKLDGNGICGDSNFQQVDVFGHANYPIPERKNETRSLYMNVPTKEDCLQKCSLINGGCGGFKFDSSKTTNQRGEGNANCQTYTMNGISGPSGDGTNKTNNWLQCINISGYDTFKSESGEMGYCNNNDGGSGNNISGYVYTLSQAKIACNNNNNCKAITCSFRQDSTYQKCKLKSKIPNSVSDNRFKCLVKQ